MKDEDIKLPKMPSQYFCKPWHHDIEEYDREAVRFNMPQARAAEPLPFDLEKAKSGHPIVTRDGRKARFCGYAEELKDGYRLIALVDGQNSVTSFYDNGLLTSYEDTSYDLFLAQPELPKMRTVWANYYPDGNVDCFKHKTDAEEYATSNATHVAVEIQIPDLG